MLPPLRIALAVTTLAAVLATAIVFAGGAGARTSGHHVWRQSKRQAEVTLLHATTALKRLEPRLIDPRTHLVRTNTRAVCTGVGRGVNGAYTRFRCLISYRTQRILVAYRVLGTNGASLKKIASYKRG
jgi:hypothetical protein